MLSHLLLMRHAKSSWANPDQSDHARPLNKRGRASADAVGRVLHSRGYSPDLIWASDSMRTKETAQRLVRIIPGAQMAVYEAGFYHASAEQVLNLCDQHGEPESGDGSAVKLMLLGHNPGWSDLYEMFSGQSHAFPTASCAVFERKDEAGYWLSPNSWRVIDLLMARDLLGDDHG